MQRRGFLSALGATALAPYMPLPKLAAPIAASYNRYMYGLAVFHARTRAFISTADLMGKLKVTSAQAEAMMGEMLKKGVIAPSAQTAGLMRAVSPNDCPDFKTIKRRETVKSVSTPDTIDRHSQDEREEFSTMEKFTKVTSVAAPMPLVNIDTDMIIPKQFLKTIKRSGLGVNLFDEMRYDQEGNEIPDFVLNQAAYREAEIIVAGDNFGCGSSREHAPWALKDFGIKVIISTSFADIFYNNCFKNGILPIVVSPDDHEKLMDDAKRGANSVLTVDLENQEITGPDGGTVSFEIDSFKKHVLLEGLDDIGLTMQKASNIDHFEAKYQAQTPWS